MKLITPEHAKTILKHLSNLKGSLHELSLHLNFSGLWGSSLDRANIKSDNELELTFSHPSDKKKIVLRVESVTDDFGKATLQITRSDVN